MLLSVFFSVFTLQLLPIIGVQAADDQTRLIEQLANRVDYLENMMAIQQLQSQYAHWLFTQDYAKILEHSFARHAEGIAIEFSDSGEYRGREGVTRLFRAFETTKGIPGFFTLHMTVNPYIVIAKDGQSARSTWLSPGAAASPSGARWIWGPYYVDYVKEDGDWKILKSVFAPLFRNRYEHSWIDETVHGSVRESLSVEPDGPPTLYQPYDKNRTDLFVDFPELPEPY
jgi:hypothetical protein